MNISSIIIPLITIIIIIYAVYKKVDIFFSFLVGVKEGLSTTLGIFPTIFAMVIAVDIFLKSNLITDITSHLAPILSKINLNPSLIPLCLLRPISSSSSLVILNDILAVYTPDSMVGRIASVIQGSTDTTIYIISLYFSSVGITKIKHSLLIGLLVDLSCVIIAIITVNLLF